MGLPWRQDAPGRYVSPVCIFPTWTGSNHITWWLVTRPTYPWQACRGVRRSQSPPHWPMRPRGVLVYHADWETVVCWPSHWEVMKVENPRVEPTATDAELSTLPVFIHDGLTIFYRSTVWPLSTWAPPKYRLWLGSLLLHIRSTKITLK